MVAAVAGEERDPPTADFGHGQRIGRLAVRRLDRVLGRTVEKGVEPGSPNDADIGTYGHPQTLTGGLCASYGAMHGVDLCRAWSSCTLTTRASRI